MDEYEIIRSLGGGGMGQVYLAQDAVLGRRVAVKFIAQDNPSDASRERFLIEARAIARLQHPNVLAIYRVGLINGQPYLVSEFVRGQSLDKLALPLPWQRALDIAVQLARGLGAAHRQGVAKIQYNSSRRLWPMKTQRLTEAAGYLRVSSEQQARQGVGLDAQRHKLRVYCKAMVKDSIDVRPGLGLRCGGMLLS